MGSMVQAMMAILVPPPRTTEKTPERIVGYRQNAFQGKDPISDMFQVLEERICGINYHYS